jgi:hypothetical protein
MRLSSSFVAVVLAALSLPASADLLEPGDIMIPGNHITDIFGNRNGTLNRLRSGVLTTILESPKFRDPTDSVIDGAGRIVFMASPSSRNVFDTALFRFDPASGQLERLWYFPYYVVSGDSLPSGASDVTEFHGVSTQSL